MLVVGLFAAKGAWAKDETVRLWSMTSSGPVRTFERHNGSVLSGPTHTHQWIAFSPDGNRLCSGDKNTTVVCWELAWWRSPIFLYATPALNLLRNFLLVGPRQMGKSTLLKGLERRLRQRPDVEAHYLTLADSDVTAHLAHQPPC